MRKCLPLLLVIPLLLTACADAQISYRLGGDSSVNTDYRLTLAPGETDVAQYTNEITQYWNNMGFTTSFDETDGVITVGGSKSDACETPEAAAQAFSAILDNNSLFQDAELIYTPSFDYDQYRLTAGVSLQDIIRQSDVQNIPDGEIESLESKAAQGTYTLCISLPGEVVSTNADSVQDGVCTWTLPYGEVTRITLETSRLNQENQSYYAQLSAQRKRDERFLLICAGAAAVIAAALFILLIVRKRRNRPLKVHVKKF